MVEFALLLPVLLFLSVAAIDYARVFYYSQTLENCARNGAIYASDPYSPLHNNPSYTDYKTCAIADGQSLNPALAVGNVTCTPSTPVEGSDVAVTVTYSFPTITSYLLGANSVTLTKTVTMRVSQNVPDQ